MTNSNNPLPDNGTLTLRASFGIHHSSFEFSARSWTLVSVALLVLCFGLAASLDTWFQSWKGNRLKSADVLGTLLGDGRKMFAQHFFVKADAYFHSGYYPTVFDNRESFKTPHMAEDAGAVGGENTGDENSFLGRPRDWIDAWSRRFYPSVHTHLDEGGAAASAQHAANAGDLGDSSQVREILPWLRVSAAFDPERVKTYTVTAYWLRQRMGKVDEAEQFLREGLKVNPDSYEILYELGRVCAENRNDLKRARNLWEAALGKWLNQQEHQAELGEPDKFLLNQIVAHLAMAEKDLGDYQNALAHMRLWKQCSPEPQVVEERIHELQVMIAQASKP